MNKSSICCLLLIITFSCAPKLSQSGHYQNLSEVTDFSSQGKYRALGETMPSEFWLIFDKNEYLERLEEIGEKTGPVIIKDLQIIDVSSPIKSNGKHFQVVKYSTNLQMDTSKIPGHIIERYKETFGEENIRLDSENNQLFVKNESKMLAVYEEDLRKWEYMELNLPIVTKVFGLETAMDLEKYVR